MATERDIAIAIAQGKLPSPTTFMNSAFYKCRFSGTGVSWRPSHEEFVYRPPRVWLAPEMCERVCGVPVIAEHPETAMLDGHSFFDSIVGICVLGFVEGDDLMAIVRVIDKRARTILDAGEFDTSPAVAFEPDQNTTVQLGDDWLIVEEGPVQIDHLALIATEQGNKGVWTKPGADPGVEISTTE